MILKSKTIFDAAEANEIKEEKRKLISVARDTQTILFKAKAIFPFDLFPNEIIISKEQVSIVINEFFLARHIEVMPIGDIQSVTVETAPFFATLILREKVINQFTRISYLKLSDGLKAQRIIQGLMLTKKEKIPVEHLSPQEIAPQVEKMGTVKE